MYLYTVGYIFSMKIALEMCSVLEMKAPHSLVQLFFCNLY